MLSKTQAQTPSIKASLLDDPYPLLDDPSPTTFFLFFFFHPSIRIDRRIIKFYI
jgi:hypothetical protein